ncbi:hypothetical protein, partial [Paraburkholderia sp. C35]|uniref:hypothetical protein n=1 Tax=Paraburkholderia sp. C35 TaxID=2126993 RepID=UPI00194F27A9
LRANPTTNAESVTTRHSNHLSPGLQREFFNSIGRTRSAVKGWSRWIRQITTNLHRLRTID